MNHGFKKLSLLLILIFAIPDLVAAPGTPIGGIIVKGGKNPGGQMLIKARTDSTGVFTLDFTEGGEYKLVFEQPQPESSFGRSSNASMQLDYTVETTGNTSRHTPFHNKIENSTLIITVPAGGGIVRGELRSSDPAHKKEPSQRAINESGVSVKSEPVKTPPKH